MACSDEPFSRLEDHIINESLINFKFGNYKMVAMTEYEHKLTRKYAIKGK